jgi:hypothetical protein
MNTWNRRDFMKYLGFFIGCCMNGVDLRGRPLSARKHFSPLSTSLTLYPRRSSMIGTKASFTGIGPAGSDAAETLIHVFEYANESREVQGLRDSTFEIRLSGSTDSPSPQMIEEQQLVFLLGSTSDPEFEFTRETILSSPVDYLLTMGLVESNSNTPDIKTSKNEGLLFLSPPVDFFKVSQLIFHLFSVLTTPSYLSIDLNDYINLFGGTHLEWSVYESSPSKNPQGYNSFSRDVMKRHEESGSLLLIFCYGNPCSTKVSDIERALEPFERLVKDDVDLFVSTDWTTPPDVAFEVHLVWGGC